MEKYEEKRIGYIDALRSLAIFAVLLVHSHVANYYTETIRLDEQIISILLGQLSSLGVPLFFMISGALLLNKEENYKGIFKRVFRFVVVLVTFSFIQYIFLGGEPTLGTYEGWRHRIISCFWEKGWLDFLTYFFSYIWSKQIITEYWYLYFYIDFLLFLPILRKVCKNLDKQLMIYMGMGLLLVKGIIPECEKILGLDEINIHFSAFQYIVAYPIIGNYLGNYDIEIKHSIKHYIKLLVVFFCINMLLFLVEYNVYGYQFFRPDKFIVIYAILVFAIFKEKDINRNNNSILTATSSAAFGIYLLEYVLHAIHRSLYENYATYLPFMLAICIRNAISIMLGVVIFGLIKRIKIVRKFL